MTKNRIKVSFDGKNFFWIVVDNGKLIKNPSKEDLYGSKLISYNETNVCAICLNERDEKRKELTDKSILYPHNTCRNIDKNGDITNIYVCHRHHNINYQRYSPNSRNNLIKTIRDRRTNNLKDFTHIFGDDCQELTHIWTGAEDLNKKFDNYNYLYDHGPIRNGFIVEIGGKLVDLSGKIPQTKGVHFKRIRGEWSTSHIDNERFKKFDYLIYYCTSDDRKIIERIYFIPKKEIYNPETNQWRKSITIMKNPKDNYRNPKITWYQKYIVTDEEVLRKVNNIWKEINIDLINT